MNIQEFFQENSRVALAFSGGVDSSYLLYAGQRYAKDICAYYVNAAFQPEFELEDARRLAKELGAKLKVISLEVLNDPKVVRNSSRRCYYCKNHVFSEIKKAAQEDGYTLLIDGTNASDDAADRPGMQALQELSVRSPLRECGMTKAEVRERSRQAGLFTWDKPAYACLATRIPMGMEITRKKLEITEYAENLLFQLGFSDFRIRMTEKGGNIQLTEAQMPLLLTHRKEILEKLKPYYGNLTLDLEARS